MGRGVEIHSRWRWNTEPQSSFNAMGDIKGVRHCPAEGKLHDSHFKSMTFNRKQCIKGQLRLGQFTFYAVKNTLSSMLLNTAVHIFSTDSIGQECGDI